MQLKKNCAKLFGLAICFFVVMLKLGTANAEVQQTGTFSTLSFHKESGDLSGYELRVLLTKNGYKGTFQICEGGAGEVYLIDVEINGDKIAFQVPDKSGSWNFEGKILKNGIKGTAVSVGGNPVLIVLPRKKSHWD